MIVAGEDEHEKQILKEKLATKLEMKDLRKLKYFLGIEVSIRKKASLSFKERMFLIFSRKHVRLIIRSLEFL